MLLDSLPINFLRRVSQPLRAAALRLRFNPFEVPLVLIAFFTVDFLRSVEATADLAVRILLLLEGILTGVLAFAATARLVKVFGVFWAATEGVFADVRTAFFKFLAELKFFVRFFARLCVGDLV